VVFSVHSESLAWGKSEATAKVLGESQSACLCVMKDCPVEHLEKPLPFGRGDCQAQVVL